MLKIIYASGKDFTIPASMNMPRDQYIQIYTEIYAADNSGSERLFRSRLPQIDEMDEPIFFLCTPPLNLAHNL